MQRKFLLRGIGLAFLISFLSSCSCDPEGKKACSWYLEPEIGQIDRVQPGYVPLCARNRKTMKQDCRLQAKIELAQNASGKPFRYVDMKIASVALPRTITDITFCGENL